MSSTAPWGSSGALATAALGLRTPSTVLVVVPFPRDLDGWVDDLAGFAGLPPLNFPAWDNLPTGDTALDEVAGQRLRALRQMEGRPPPRLVIATIQALIQPVPERPPGPIPPRDSGRRAAGPRRARAWLVEHGYRRTEAVELPGEFSRRGGILDVFSPDAEAAVPPRVLRRRDRVDPPVLAADAAQPRRQSSGRMMAANVERWTSAAAEGAGSAALTGHLCDYLPADAWTVLVEPEDLHEQGKHYLERVADARGLFSVAGRLPAAAALPERHALGPAAARRSRRPATCASSRSSASAATSAELRDELDAAAGGDRVLIACHNEAECKRLGEVLAAGPAGAVRPAAPGHRAASAPASAWSTPGVVVLGDHELFHREEARQVLPRRRLESRAIDSFLDLAEGDLVVHVSHGIARFRGMQVLDKNGQTEEHLILEFRDGVARLRAGVEDRPGAEVRRRRQDRPGAVQARRHRLAAQEGQGRRRPSSTWPAR